MYKVFIEQFDALPPINRREVLRYAGVHGAVEDGLNALLEECFQEASEAFCGKVCYCKCSVSELFDAIPTAEQSQNLRLALRGCDSVILFAATVGLEIDRLMQRYLRLSPTKSLLFQALGAERIEAICDLFCEQLKQDYAAVNCSLKPRFSAGYGDFPLEAQKAIFALLNASKAIGVSLTESLMMIPTKSVSALIGVKDNTRS